MTYKTNWTKIENVFKVGNKPNNHDGVFVALGENDKKLLKKALDTSKRVNDLEYDFDKIDPQYYLERNEATHMFISVVVPDIDNYNSDYINVDAVPFNDTEITWWDFMACLAKVDKDGNMLIWSDDDGGVGYIWYQQSYTKKQAYGVSVYCEELTKKDKLFNDFAEDNHYDYDKNFSDNVDLIMEGKEIDTEEKNEEDLFKIDIVITDKFIGTLKNAIKFYEIAEINEKSIRDIIIGIVERTITNHFTSGVLMGLWVKRESISGDSKESIELYLKEVLELRETKSLPDIKSVLVPAYNKKKETSQKELYGKPFVRISPYTPCIHFNEQLKDIVRKNNKKYINITVKHRDSATNNGSIEFRFEDEKNGDFSFELNEEVISKPVLTRGFGGVKVSKMFINEGFSFGRYGIYFNGEGYESFTIHSNDGGIN